MRQSDWVHIQPQLEPRRTQAAFRIPADMRSLSIEIRDFVGQFVNPRDQRHQAVGSRAAVGVAATFAYRRIAALWPATGRSRDVRSSPSPCWVEAR